jgi:hypothetical protein
MANQAKLNTYRRTAVIVGILFIIATVFLFIGQAIYEPFLNTPETLEVAYPNRTNAVAGMLLEFACVLAIPLIPVFMFPVLRKHAEALALAYVGFRFFETILFFIPQINKLLLINLSQGYLEQGGVDASYYQNLGSSIQSWNEWAFIFYLFFFTIGAAIFYFALYQSRLVPRFISGWGFLAAVLLLIGTVLQMFEVNFGLSGAGFQLIFALPIAVNEMVLAVWLIVKGFNPSAVDPEELHSGNEQYSN